MKGKNRLRFEDRAKLTLLTDQEKDALNDFEETGFNRQYQNFHEKVNLYDIYETFLLKIHHPKLQRDFLNRYKIYNYLKDKSS
jgi:hypothetical protein